MIEYCKKNWKNILLVGLIILYISINFYQKNNSSDLTADTISNQTPKSDNITNINKLWLINIDKVPSYVIDTLIYIRQNNKAPDGFVGGRNFTNYEKVLPYGPYYTERDVKKHIKWVNRWPQRLVTETKHAYYTLDHYQTFIQLQ